MKFASLIAAGLLVFVVSGCAKKPTVVGKWKVAPEVTTKDPKGTQAGFMTGFASTFRYEFKEDNTFQGSMSEGTYTLDGDKLSVKTTKLMGQDIAKLTKTAVPPMTGELSADGESLMLHPPTGPGLPEELKNIKMVRDK